MKRISGCIVMLCAASLATAASGPSGGDWKDQLAEAAGGMTLGAEKGMLFYAYDTLAHVGSPVDLTVCLQSVKGFSGVEGVTVTFYKDGKALGAAKTDGDGFAKIPWTPPAEGRIEFTAKITGPGNADEDITEISEASLLVAAYPKDKPLVIVDLDHTVVASSFFRVLAGGAQPMADSQDVLKRLARTYGLVYLTHRPNIMTRNSKQWLIDNDYPRAPLLVSKLKEAFGDSGTFKTGRIKQLRESFTQPKIGIGDKLSDALAYVDNGMTAYLIPNYKDKVEDLREMAKELRALRNKERLQVVGSWAEVQAGIFENKRFPADDFAKKLEARADELAQQKADRNRDKKDDEEEEDDD